jgi:hypothetical protein
VSLNVGKKWSETAFLKLRASSFTDIV